MPLFKYHVFQCRILCYLKVGYALVKLQQIRIWEARLISLMHFIYSWVYTFPLQWFTCILIFFTFQIPYMMPLLCKNAFPIPYIIYSYKQGADYFNFLFYITKRTIVLKCGCGYFFYAFFSAPSLLLNINTKSVPSNIFLQMFHFSLLLYSI